MPKTENEPEEKRPSDVPTGSIDEDIPETAPPEVAQRAILGTGQVLTPPLAPAEPEQGMGPGEFALERERRARRAKPGP